MTLNKEENRREIFWPKVLFHVHLNVLFLYGVYIIFTEAHYLTTIFSFMLVLFGILGVTAGAHRLWAHKSYKASTRLKIFLMLCQTLAGQGSIYDWVQQHRVHHQHFKTDLDPFNPSKGFIFSQYISAMFKLSNAQTKALKDVDMSDLTKDKIVMFQKKYYWLLYIIVFLLLPINAPAEYWGETIKNSLFIVGWVRYAVVLNMSWLIHSGTRIWGIQPGEKYPCDTNLVFILTKNYWLQYHYLFSWDYQTSEYGKYGTDCTSKFIRICAALGDAIELRTIDSDNVRQALTMSIDSKRPITECLLEVENYIDTPSDRYLKPAKFL